MNKVVKKSFSISEFEDEAKWLSDMHKSGWKFVGVDGNRYEFEPCSQEDWVYELDFKEEKEEDDYIQMYEDFGWEYVTKLRKWYYFRKKREDAVDLSIFSDKESKIDMCRRVINGQFVILLPLYAIMLVYGYFTFFTDVFRGESFWNGLAMGIGMGAMLVVVFGFGWYIGQVMRINNMIKGLEHPIK